VSIRKLTAATAAASVLAVAAPLATAGTASASTAGGSNTPPRSGLTFVPPSVGPICVVIGPIILGGKVMSPGLHVCTTGVSLPPLHRGF
jgi:hypothetical protein